MWIVTVILMLLGAVVGFLIGATWGDERRR